MQKEWFEGRGVDGDGEFNEGLPPESSESLVHRAFRVGVIALGLFALAAILAEPARAEEPSLEEVFQKVGPAVGALYAQKSDGSLQFLCSITATEKQAKRTVLLTAYHCVEKNVAYMVSFDGKQFHSARVYQIPRWEVDPNKYRKHFGIPEVDMAFFAIEEALDVPTVAIGNDLQVRPGRKIVMVGFPLGVAKISYNGIVSGRLARPGDSLDGYLTLQIFGSPGSSGSAVIDQNDGKVIGVLVAGKQESGLPVIFATPIHYQTYLLNTGQPETK